MCIRDRAKKDLAEAQNKLAVAENKIKFTVEGRLGGKDRFETAAAVAQYWADNTMHVFDDIYVADAHATADALVAGQLTRGPLLLVASGQEIPAATKAVASALPTWDNQSGKAHKTVYGIGGEGVLKDETLTDLYKVINAAAKGSGSGKESGKLAVASGSTLDVILDSQDGAATFTWDKLAATDFAAGNVLCAEAKAVGVTLQTGACTFAAAGIKIDRSNVTLADATKPGTITVPVEYRGEELEVTFTVYSSTSAAVTTTAGTAPAAAALKATNGSVTYEEAIATPGSNAEKQVTVKEVKSSKTGTSATAEIKGQKLVVHINGSDKWAAGDTVKVTLVNTDPGKAPNDTKVVTIALG